MSLSPASINSMLTRHSGIMKQALTYAPTPKIIRKHYSEYEHPEHHEEYHHYSKKQSRSIALTALTLLAFLFFLHILQQCIHDQIEMSTTTPPTVVMQANILTKEGSENVLKEAQDRLDLDDSQSIEEQEQLTTTFSESYEERQMVTKGYNIHDESRFDSYEKMHVPVKVKLVEKTKRIKNI